MRQGPWHAEAEVNGWTRREPVELAALEETRSRSASRPIASSDGPPTGDVSLRRAALIAGIGLLLMAIVALSSGLTLDALVVDGNAAKTARNVFDHAQRLRFVAGGFVIVAVLDLVVAWALYVLLRPVNRSVAMLAAWLRVAYAAIFVTSVTSLFSAVRDATGADFVRAFPPRQLDAQVVTAVNAFKDGWNLALVIFGLHLLVLGYLVVKSSYIPSVLGVLLMIAAVGYLIDSAGGLLSTSYSANVAAFTFVGEVLLMGWLLWRGRSLQEPTNPAMSRIGG
jgi:hypothetical protein